MNYWISVLFRIIPLAMGAICLGYGWYIWDMGSDANTYVAGHVVLFLSIICVALFTTAATIIRQLIHTYSARPSRSPCPLSGMWPRPSASSEA